MAFSSDKLSAIMVRIAYQLVLCLNPENQKLGALIRLLYIPSFVAETTPSWKSLFPLSSAWS
jgi:hypothetical protein